MGLCGSHARAATIQEAIGAVPAEASLVVAVKSLASASEDVAAVHAALRTGMPELADVLGQWQQRTGFVQGIDAGGPAAVALFNAPDAQSNSLLVLTATSYEEFVTASGDQGGGEISALNTPDGRTPSARSVPPFVLITADPDAARRYIPPDATDTWTSRLSDTEVQCINRSEIAILVDVPRCAALIRLLSDAWTTRLQPAGFDLDPLTGQVYAAMRAIAHATTEYAIVHAARLVIGLDVDEDALQVTCVTTFHEESGLGGQPAPAADGAAKDLLSHLPDAPILFAAAIDAQALPWSAMLGAVAQQLSAHNVGMLRALHTGAEDRWDAVDRHAMVIYDTRHKTAVAGHLRVVRLEEGGDSGAILDDVRTLLGAVGGRTVDLGNQRYGLSAQYLENAQRIRQVNVDRFTLQFDRPADVPSRDKAVRSFLAATAAAGQRGYVAAIDDRMLAYTNTTDSRFINAVVEAAKAGEALGRKNTWQALRHSTEAADAQMEILLAAPLITTLLGGEMHRETASVPSNPDTAKTQTTIAPLGISVSTGQHQWTIRAAASMGLMIEVSEALSARENSPPGGPGGFFPGGPMPR